MTQNHVGELSQYGYVCVHSVLVFVGHKWVGLGMAQMNPVGPEVGSLHTQLYHYLNFIVKTTILLCTLEISIHKHAITSFSRYCSFLELFNINLTIELRNIWICKPPC